MAEPSPMQPAQRSAEDTGRIDAQLLTLVTGNINRQLGIALATEELSVEQWYVLDHLDGAGPCAMSTLAGATSINGATLTRVVDRLVSRALVYRTAGRDDRRRILVHLSERGRQTTQRVRPHILDAQDRVGSSLSADERNDLRRLLQRMSAHEARNS